MQSTAKAIALIRGLHSNLKNRLENNAGVNTISFAFDSNNWPYLLIFNATDGIAEGNPVIFIRISNVPMVSTDIFGNATYAYSPDLLEFAYELSSGGAPLPARADIITCEYESILTGVQFQLKELANGTAVTAANVSADVSPVVSLDNLYWPTKGV
jgi:hypothetical protein